jgi:Cu(I)/Ag(I) efflux system membrane fusion protein
MTRPNAIRLVLIVLSLAVAFFLGTRVSERGPGGGPAHEHVESEVWTCSMHPQIRLPESGKCPICFMDLVPVGAGSQGDDEVQLTMSRSAMKLAEIRTAEVVREHPRMELRLVGKVETDETRVRTLAARTGGRLDRLYVDYTGVNVREGDHLVSMYSPELVAAQEELLQALRARQELERSEVEVLRDTAARTVEAVRDKLRLLGLTAGQIAEIETSGEVKDHLTIYSPIDGVVLEKLADQGSYVKTGDPIYRLADLSHVWVMIDAYESDLSWLRFGQLVTFAAEAWPGRQFTGRILFIDPVLDPRSRTAKVRVNLDNSDFLLKPGMFVRAVVHPEIARGGRVMAADLRGKWISPMHPEVVKDGPGACDVCGMDLVPAEEMGYAMESEDAPAPLVIPATAPLITGRRAVVYVQVPGTDRPTFEGREVVLGPRARDQYVVVEGLAEGERVVVNGAFKIDSAMQIQARPSMMAPRTEDPSFAATDAFREALGRFVIEVMDLSNALSADDPAAATAIAGGLGAAVGAVPDAGLREDARDYWAELQAELDRRANELVSAEGIDSMRERLPEMTAATARAVRVFGVDGAGSVRLFHCPMAFENTGADWLQSDEATANPYFGASMFRCGSQKEILAGADQ